MIVALAMEDDPNEKPREPEQAEIDKLLLAHDIPPAYWKSFTDYARTGRITSGELRHRLASLKQFQGCQTALRELTRRDYPVQGDGFTYDSVQL